jgi:hypothetical protein
MTGKPIPHKLAQYRALLQSVEPAVCLFPARLARRIAHETTNHTGSTLNVPHWQCLWVQREQLLRVVSPSELNCPGTAQDYAELLVVAEPETETLRQPLPTLQLLAWRTLLHARIDQAINAIGLSEAQARRRLASLGSAVVEEIESVLRSEGYIHDQSDAVTIYREFLALYFDLRFFCPQFLPSFFPSLPSRQAIEQLATQDVNVHELFSTSRPPGAPDPQVQEGHELHQLDEEDAEPQVRQILTRAEELANMGNQVRAAILRFQASRLCTSDAARDAAIAAARADIEQLAERLRVALELTDDFAEDWRTALQSLLEPASAIGWTAAALILYDLQQICIDHEQEIYTVDLVEWVLTFGRRPIKRKLVYPRWVRTLRTLRNCYKRLGRVHISEYNRNHLVHLFQIESHRAEDRLRQQLEPVIATVLHRVGLVPSNQAEQVALEKAVAEMLDLIGQRGFLTISTVRDVIARNQLKLPDLSGPLELIRGDPLLQMNRQLADQLDGVYRRGEIYLRGLQRFSSLLFGTSPGRLLTRYFLLPVLGAVMLLLGPYFVVEHPLEWLGIVPKHEKHTRHPTYQVAQVEIDDPDETTEPEPLQPPADPADQPGGDDQPPANQPADQPGGENQPPAARLGDRPAPPPAARPGDRPAPPPALAEPVGGGLSIKAKADPADDHWYHAMSPLKRENRPAWGAAIAGMSLFLFLILHWPWFRQWVFAGFRRLGRLFYILIFDLPGFIYRLPLIRPIIDSPPVQWLYHHLTAPLIFTALIAGLLRLVVPWNEYFAAYTGVLFVALFFFCNSRMGRDLTDWIYEGLLVTWRMIRHNLLPGIVSAIVDLFSSLAEAVERTLYSVDEWLRFRKGDRQVMLWLKAILSVPWFFISYVVRFIFIVLFEPQVNPVKHFPVVTVGHKLILPLVPTAGQALSSATGMGIRQANATALTIIGLIPGVFGFLVWELLSNWRLYRSNRSPHLKPERVGSHGETIAGLLRPGFHSGTLPKTFAKLRTAEKRALTTGSRRALRRLRVQLEHVAESVQHFAERQLIAVLDRSERCRHLLFTVRKVDLDTRRIHISLSAVRLDPAADRPQPMGAATITFEERHGYLTARISEPGWLVMLDAPARAAFADALKGFYKLAGIDLIHEHILAQNDPTPADWTIDRDGLLVLTTAKGEEKLDLETIDQEQRAKWLYNEWPLNWDDWVATWEADARRITDKLPSPDHAAEALLDPKQAPVDPPALLPQIRVLP